MNRRMLHITSVALVGLVAACTQREIPRQGTTARAPVAVADERREAAFLFGVPGLGQNDQFVARTADPALLARVRDELAKPLDHRLLHIHGRVEPAAPGDNLGWSWAFARDGWELAEVSAELCDGRPSYVENDLDYWMNEVGAFCPWASRVLEEVH